MDEIFEDEKKDGPVPSMSVSNQKISESLKKVRDYQVVYFFIAPNL